MNWGSLINFLPLIFGVVQHVEDTVHAPGVSKKAKAMDLILTGIQTTSTLAPGVLAHPGVQAAIGNIVDGVVAAANAARDAGDHATPPVVTGPALVAAPELVPPAASGVHTTDLEALARRVAALEQTGQ